MRLCDLQCHQTVTWSQAPFYLHSRSFTPAPHRIPRQPGQEHASNCYLLPRAQVPNSQDFPPKVPIGSLWGVCELVRYMSRHQLEEVGWFHPESGRYGDNTDVGLCIIFWDYWPLWNWTRLKMEKSTSVTGFKLLLIAMWSTRLPKSNFLMIFIYVHSMIYQALGFSKTCPVSLSSISSQKSIGFNTVLLGSLHWRWPTGQIQATSIYPVASLFWFLFSLQCFFFFPFQGKWNTYELPSWLMSGLCEYNWAELQPPNFNQSQFFPLIFPRTLPGHWFSTFLISLRHCWRIRVSPGLHPLFLS